MRLAARIADLRDDGYNVQTTIIKRRSPRTGKQVAYARYSMPSAKNRLITPAEFRERIKPILEES